MYIVQYERTYDCFLLVSISADKWFGAYLFTRTYYISIPISYVRTCGMVWYGMVWKAEI